MEKIGSIRMVTILLNHKDSNEVHQIYFQGTVFIIIFDMFKNIFDARKINVNFSLYFEYILSHMNSITMKIARKCVIFRRILNLSFCQT